MQNILHQNKCNSRKFGIWEPTSSLFKLAQRKYKKKKTKNKQIFDIHKSPYQVSQKLVQPFWRYQALNRATHIHPKAHANKPESEIFTCFFCYLSFPVMTYFKNRCRLHRIYTYRIYRAYACIHTYEYICVCYIYSILYVKGFI